MKEWIVDLYPIGGAGQRTKVRIFAANQSAALRTAREMNPRYRTGNVKPANQ
ncbi:hypothetical protein [Flavobacterium sp.]|uniref:hypothetical protein n=1 Tax=Flavobacterium sp. TaxID=239 RepID=UPI00262A2116|nr:hypothetical protein [Flavobacterium sp.]